MKRIFILLIVVIPVVSFCTQKNNSIRANEFKTIDELAQKVIMYISKKNYTAISKLFVPDEEYKKDIFKYTPLGKQGDITAEDHFRIFIKDRRAHAVASKIKFYTDKRITFKSAGKSTKVDTLGPYRFHRRVPVKLEIMKNDGTAKVITDNDILGVVIEENGRFRLLNLFRN